MKQKMNIKTHFTKEAEATVILFLKEYFECLVSNKGNTEKINSENPWNKEIFKEIPEKDFDKLGVIVMLFHPEYRDNDLTLRMDTVSKTQKLILIGNQSKYLGIGLKLKNDDFFYVTSLKFKETKTLPN